MIKKSNSHKDTEAQETRRWEKRSTRQSRSCRRTGRGYAMKGLSVLPSDASLVFLVPFRGYVVFPHTSCVFSNHEGHEDREGGASGALVLHALHALRGCIHFQPAFRREPGNVEKVTASSVSRSGSKERRRAVGCRRKAMGRGP